MAYRLVCLLAPRVVVFLMSTMPTKSKSLCPGCKMPKQNHAFAALSEHCARLTVENEILDNELSESEELPPCKEKSVSLSSAERQLVNCEDYGLEWISHLTEGVGRFKNDSKRDLSCVWEGPLRTKYFNVVCYSLAELLKEVCANKTSLRVA